MVEPAVARRVAAVANGMVGVTGVPGVIMAAALAALQMAVFIPPPGQIAKSMGSEYLIFAFCLNYSLMTLIYLIVEKL